MSERTPRPSVHTPEELARMRAEARRDAKEGVRVDEAYKAMLREQALANARARANQMSSPQAPPAAPNQAPLHRPSVRQDLPPTQTPPSGAIRVPRVHRSAPVPVQELVPRGGVVDKVDKPEKTTRRKKLPIKKSVAVIACLGAGVFVADKVNIFDPSEVLANVAQSDYVPNVNANSGSGKSEYGEIELPAVTMAEGLNLENCKKEDATIASFRLDSAHYAIPYQVQTAENAVVTLPPYINTFTDQLSTTTAESTDEQKAAAKANAKYETESGYPEMVIQNLVLEVNACQKPNTAAVTQENGIDTVNLANIDFSVKLNVSPDAKRIDQNKDMKTLPGDVLPEDILYTWPQQTFIPLSPDDPKKYTDASVEAAKAAHVSADQERGVFNAAVKALVATAADASLTSEFNETVTFVDKNTKTFNNAIKEGLKVRLGNDNLNWNGTIETITPVLDDKKPALVDTTVAAEKSFMSTPYVEKTDGKKTTIPAKTSIVGEIIVGKYVDPFETSEGK